MFTATVFPKKRLTLSRRPEGRPESLSLLYFPVLQTGAVHQSVNATRAAVLPRKSGARGTRNVKKMVLLPVIPATTTYRRARVDQTRLHNLLRPDHNGPTPI